MQANSINTISMKKIIVTLTLSIFILSGCNTGKKEETVKNTKIPREANPATEYCFRQGGKPHLWLDEDEDDGVAGLCVLETGEACDEWEFYRGECPEEEDTTK